MLPKTHIILGLFFSLFILILFPNIGLLGFIIIFLSSFLIDIDHYLFHVWLKKDWNPNNAFKWFIKFTKKYQKLTETERSKIVAIPCLLHGIETLAILFLLYYFSQNIIFLYLLVGFLFHEFLDFISIWSYGYNFNHIGSQIKNIIKYKNNQNTLFYD